jgi:hypothetical protein
MIDFIHSLLHHPIHTLEQRYVTPIEIWSW